jgi:hypothetical protein
MVEPSFFLKWLLDIMAKEDDLCDGHRCFSGCDSLSELLDERTCQLDSVNIWRNKKNRWRGGEKAKQRKRGKKWVVRCRLPGLVSSITLSSGSL